MKAEFPDFSAIQSPVSSLRDSRVRNSTGAVVSENRVATVAEFIRSVPVRDHNEPGATGESGLLGESQPGQTRRGEPLIRQAGAPYQRSANRKRRPTYARLPPPAVA